MGDYHGGTWQPYGDQFPWACSVCCNSGSLKCVDCKCEREPGFEFNPNKYVNLCKKFAGGYCEGEKYWFVGGERGAGKILRLEQMLAKKEAQLKLVKEDREYFKELASSMIQRVVELSQMYIDKE